MELQAMSYELRVNQEIVITQDLRLKPQNVSYRREQL